MYLYIELWKAKDAWRKLSTDERRAKMDHLIRDAAAHPVPGVIPLSFRQVGDVFVLDPESTQPAIIDDAVARPTGFRYAAAWMIPTKALIKTFEQRVENLGWWFDYFEQKNAWGELNVQATLADIIGAPLRPPPVSQATPPPPERSERMGRFGQTVHAVRQLRDDVDELKKGVNVVLDYVKTEQRKG
jgi:hypothetical protein